LTENTYKDKLTLYVPANVKTQLIPLAKTIFKREESSLSKWFVEALTRYIEVHKEGNPQLRIVQFTGLPSEKECFFCKGHFPLLKKVEYVSGLVAYSCEPCLQANRAKGSSSTVKRVLGKA
jgi:hypothetical protein